MRRRENENTCVCLEDERCCGWQGPIMGLSAVVSMAVYSRHDLTRERHREILRVIQRRKAERSDE